VALAQYRQKIKDFVCGDSLIVQRTIRRIPSGLTLTKSWLTVKDVVTDLDADAIFQKTITATLSSAGQITDTGSDGVGTVRFTLSHAETILLTPGVSYFFDIQVVLSDGGLFTVSKGTIKGLQEITIATS
jgi:hypothetical protein